MPTVQGARIQMPGAVYPGSDPPLALGLMVEFPLDPCPPLLSCLSCHGQPAAHILRLVPLLWSPGMLCENQCWPHPRSVHHHDLTAFSLSWAESWVRHRCCSRWGPPSGLLGDMGPSQRTFR